MSDEYNCDVVYVIVFDSVEKRDEFIIKCAMDSQDWWLDAAGLIRLNGCRIQFHEKDYPWNSGGKEALAHHALVWFAQELSRMARQGEPGGIQNVGRLVALGYGGLDDFQEEEWGFVSVSEEAYSDAMSAFAVEREIVLDEKWSDTPKKALLRVVTEEDES